MVSDSVTPQWTRYGKNYGLSPGISLFENNGVRLVSFIPWAELKPEIESKLLPQASMFINPGSTAKTAPLRGEPDWIVRVVGAQGEDLADIWYGSDPLNRWAYDGLVRIGPSDGREPIVWQIYQRYSDGSYRRLFSAGRPK